MNPPRASARELLLVAALLVVTATAVYGPHVVEGGFTIDDWGNAAGVAHPASGLFADWWALSPNRPGQVIYIPLTHVVFGPHQHIHLAWAILLAVAMSVALYALLRRLSCPARYSALISVLVLLFPMSDSVRFWPAASHSSLAIALGLAGLLLAFRGLEARERGDLSMSRLLHLGAVLLYAISVLTYEIAGVALLLAGALYLTRAPRRVALRRWALDIAVVAACLVWNGLQAKRARPSFSELVDHAADIADSGATIFAVAAFPFGTLERQTILTGLVAVVGAAIVVRFLMPPSDTTRQIIDKWIAFVLVGVLVAIAGWVLYIPADPYYNPSQPGVGNRVNAMAAVGVVIVVVSVIALGAVLLFRGLRHGKMAASILTVVLTSMIAVGYASDVRDDQRAWARAYSAADSTLGQIEAAAPPSEIPSGSTIYTFGQPGSERAGIVIFGFTWDLNGAVRLLYDDPTLRAYPMLEGASMECLEAGVGPTGNGFSPESNGAAYGTAYFIDVPSGAAERIDSRKACLDATSRFVPGPMVRIP